MKNPNDLITSFEGIGVQPSAGANTNQTRQKKDTQFWVNVGLTRKNAAGEAKLVSLPMGIPLDELQPRRVPSQKTQNQDFRNLRLAENELFSKLREIMATLKPGQSVTLPFQVELRRVDEKEVIEDEQDPSVNPYAVGELKVG